MCMPWKNRIERVRCVCVCAYFVVFSCVETAFNAMQSIFKLFVAYLQTANYANAARRGRRNIEIAIDEWLTPSAKNTDNFNRLNLRTALRFGMVGVNLLLVHFVCVAVVWYCRSCFFSHVHLSCSFCLAWEVNVSIIGQSARAFVPSTNLSSLWPAPLLQSILTIIPCDCSDRQRLSGPWKRPTGTHKHSTHTANAKPTTWPKCTVLQHLRASFRVFFSRSSVGGFGP